MDRIFCNIDSDKIALLIKNAEERIIYAAPSINIVIAGEILKKISDVKNIEIIIDDNPDVLRFGYGEIEAIEIIKKENLQIRICHGIRIGLICADEIAYIFTPRPLALEDEREKSYLPNAVRISDEVIDEIMLSIVPADNNIVNSEIGKEILSENKYKIIKEDIDKKPFIKPDLKRRVNVLSSIFQIVDIQLTGTKLINHKFRLDAKELGIKNDVVGLTITGTYDLFKGANIINIDKLNDKFSDIKKQFTKQVDKVGRLIHYTKNKEFQEAINKFKEEIKSTDEKKENDIQKILDKDRKEITELVYDNMKKLTDDERKSILYPEEANDKTLREFIEYKISGKFIDAKQVLSNIELYLRIYNVSEQFLEDKDIVKRIEKAYNKKIEEIIREYQAVEAHEGNNEYFNNI